MSKASRLRLRNERRRKLWLIVMEPSSGGVHYLHRDGWGLYGGYKIVFFTKRREADKVITEQVLKDPSLIGRVWAVKRIAALRQG